MASLKDVQNKISGVKKTKQITKAMNMVATSRLRGAQSAMDGFRPYAMKFSDVLGSVAGKTGANVNPLLVPRDTVRSINIVVCTSDRGLCGGFNVNLINRVEDLMTEKAGDNVDISVTAFGKKGRDWARKNKIKIASEHIGVVGARFGFNVAAKAGRRLVDDFLSGTYDEVYVVFAKFMGRAKQVPTVRQLLPIPPIETVDDAAAAEEAQVYLAEHICEPSPQELLGEMLPRNVYVQIFSALLETSTSEHAARMTAMDNATKACNDIMESLTLIYNKARQSAITAELMDIVGGAEALRG